MPKAAKGLPYSYSRRYRLAAKHEVQSVFAAKPKKVSRQYLLVLYTPNQLPYARLGIIAGKKHLRHAVDRNRVRRVIREGFRHARAMLKGLDLVVMIRSECSSVDTKTLRSDIDHLLQAIQC
ncbi:MAG TPA: ribonuclease P protein component [Gammaproteobacteria bacterium]|nr:ribonuclease P protein component [Gammaproteobacteria bacterium]